MNEKALPNSSVYILPGMVESKYTIIKAAELLMNECDTNLQLLRQRTRKREVVSVRQKIIYVLNWYGFGYSEIGRLFWHDHATMMHSCKTVENDMFTDADLKQWVLRMQHTKLRKE